MQRVTSSSGSNHSFWLTGIGGFVLGVLTVLIVLLLTRRANDVDFEGKKTERPVEVAPDVVKPR
jgi:hypothetical protein